MAYFFVLFVSSFSHSRVYPNIWKSSVYSIGWFVNPISLSGGNDQCGSPFAASKSRQVVDSWNSYLDDIEAASKDGSSNKHPRNVRGVEKAPWAQDMPIRRGVDSPFAKRETAPVQPEIPVAALPLRVQTKGLSQATMGSRFIEKFRESKILSRSESPSTFGLHFLSPVTPSAPFPPSVDNHDLPIPLPRLSEWIRADAMKGISVHTVPYSP